MHLAVAGSCTRAAHLALSVQAESPSPNPFEVRRRAGRLAASVEVARRLLNGVAGDLVRARERTKLPTFHDFLGGGRFHAHESLVAFACLVSGEIERVTTDWGSMGGRPPDWSHFCCLLRGKFGATLELPDPSRLLQDAVVEAIHLADIKRTACGTGSPGPATGGVAILAVAPPPIPGAGDGSSQDQEVPEVPPEERLRDVDREILEAVTGKTLAGKAIAKETGYDYDYVRHRLPVLIRLGRVTKGHEGYSAVPCNKA
jgi:hypothetical protein